MENLNKESEMFLALVRIDKKQKAVLEKAMLEMWKRCGKRLMKKYEGKPDDQFWLFSDIFQRGIISNLPWNKALQKTIDRWDKENLDG